MSPYVRTVKTGSGAQAVQIVHSSRRGSRDIEHIGSAHDDAELELLRAVARQRLADGQGELDLGLASAGQSAAGGDPLPITSSRMGHLCGALTQAYRVLGFEHAAGGDEVFRDLVLARVIEPTSKLDSLGGEIGDPFLQVQDFPVSGGPGHVRQVRHVRREPFPPASRHQRARTAERPGSAAPPPRRTAVVVGRRAWAAVHLTVRSIVRSLWSLPSWMSMAAHPCDRH